MFEITAAALAWLQENRAHNRVPDSFGLRVFQESGRAAITIRSVADPQADELTIVQSGLRFFVTPDIARRLSGKVIDFQPESSRPGLILRRREPVAAAELGLGAEG
jgi:Fe-S cluster assembly iron-binding protein IscA